MEKEIERVERLQVSEDIERAGRLRVDVIEKFLQVYSEELKHLPARESFVSKCYFLKGCVVRIDRKNYQLEHPVITEELYNAIYDLAEEYD